MRSKFSPSLNLSILYVIVRYECYDVSFKICKIVNKVMFLNIMCK